MQMSAKPLRVLYDEEDQIRELVGNLRHIYGYEKSIGFKFDEKFQGHVFGIGFDLCAYKHPCFMEERKFVARTYPA